MMLKLSFGTTLALDVILTLLHIVAIGTTVFRVCYRARMRRLWWDDIMASMSMLADTVYISVLWFAYAGPESMLQTYESLVARYWLSSMLFFLVLWMARISLALTVARIFPPKEATRRFAVGMALLSTSLCLVTITQSAAICSRQLATNSVPVCQWPNVLRIVVIVASIFSDALLVSTPLYKLWRVRLPRKQRRLILICFSASALTTTATVACTIFQFSPESWEPAKSVLRGKVNYLESGIALTVCNFLVVVTFLYKVFRRREDLELRSAHATEGVESDLATTMASFDLVSCSTRYTLTEIIGTEYTVANPADSLLLATMRLPPDVAAAPCTSS